MSLRAFIAGVSSASVVKEVLKDLRVDVEMFHRRDLERRGRAFGRAKMADVMPVHQVVWWQEVARGEREKLMIVGG